MSEEPEVKAPEEALPAPKKKPEESGDAAALRADNKALREEVLRLQEQLAGMQGQLTDFFDRFKAAPETERPGLLDSAIDWLKSLWEGDSDDGEN